MLPNTFFTILKSDFLSPFSKLTVFNVNRRNFSKQKREKRLLFEFNIYRKAIFFGLFLTHQKIEMKNNFFLFAKGGKVYFRCLMITTCPGWPDDFGKLKYFIKFILTIACHNTTYFLPSYHHCTFHVDCVARDGQPWSHLMWRKILQLLLIRWQIKAIRERNDVMVLNLEQIISRQLIISYFGSLTLQAPK